MCFCCNKFCVHLGSEVTLVAGSDTSEDSMDSLENQKIPKIPSFVISEPSENQPSITRGIGRKISQENEQKTLVFPSPMDSTNSTSEEFFLRRNSCYSEDSLSNDSLSIGNQSPSSGSNTQSSHHQQYDDDKMQITHELENAGGAEKFQIFQNLTLDNGNSDTGTTSTSTNNSSRHLVVRNEPSFEVELSEVCSKLEAADILEILKRTINDQVCSRVKKKPLKISAK